MLQKLSHSLFVVASVLCFSVSASALTIQNSGKYEYIHGYIQFSGKKPRVYLLKNIANGKVIVDKYLRFNPGASAGWASIIAPKNWSAIFISESSFTMTCMAKSRRGHYQKVCCKHQIKVLPVKKFDIKASLAKEGSFWLSENKPFNELKKHLAKRGVLVNTKP